MSQTSYLQTFFWLPSKLLHIFKWANDYNCKPFSDCQASCFTSSNEPMIIVVIQFLTAKQAAISDCFHAEYCFSLYLYENAASVLLACWVLLQPMLVWKRCNYPTVSFTQGKTHRSIRSGLCSSSNQEHKLHPGFSLNRCKSAASDDSDLHLHGGTCSQTVRLIGLWLVLASQQ
jgi:hypothetical protein